MSMTIRAATPMERMYLYTQSQQIIGQTGCIGHLRADMGDNGREFHMRFEDHRSDLKTEEFKAELYNTIQQLRNNKSFDGILKSRQDMAAYCASHPESVFDGGFCTMSGLRADTEQYSYLLRLIPMRGEYNRYCYCYRRDWLDQHLSNAVRGIRFITPSYQELFRVEDGDMVRITTKLGEFRDRTARYIDDYHVELRGPNGDNLYHICEFAERMEQNGCQGIIPLRKSLPEKCYSTLAETGEIIIIKKGESGYYRTDIPFADKREGKEIAEKYNRKLGVTKAQEEAMKAGSMFGWHVPAADPKNYDDRGQLRKSHSRDWSGAR